MRQSQSPAFSLKSAEGGTKVVWLPLTSRRKLSLALLRILQYVLAMD